MMSLIVKTFYRYECDRCGGKANREVPAFSSSEEARRAAQTDGFVISEWMHRGCPRQTSFCAECVADLAKAEARKLVREETQPDGSIHVKFTHHERIF